MKSYTDLEKIPVEATGCVLAVGNFDGVHLGHRALIEKAKEIALAAKAPLGVMTFEPHPRRFFQPEAEPFRLTLLPMKQRLLNDLGVNHLFVPEFNTAFSQISGEEFVNRILVRQLNVAHVVVGEDFVFGCKKSGTIETLKASGKFKVTIVNPVSSPAGQVYSSSAIRDFLRQGKFAEAEKLLGRAWSMESPVIHGDKRGRTLGFPTANQDVNDYVRIPYGVYAVKVMIEGDNVWRDGAANFGLRPMFQVKQPVFETHILDFSDEIYGKTLYVRPVEYLRPERSFADVGALTAQMKEDCIAARKVLKSLPS